MKWFVYISREESMRVEIVEEKKIELGHQDVHQGDQDDARPAVEKQQVKKPKGGRTIVEYIFTILLNEPLQ